METKGMWFPLSLNKKICFTLFTIHIAKSLKSINDPLCLYLVKGSFIHYCDAWKLVKRTSHRTLKCRTRTEYYMCGYFHNTIAYRLIISSISLPIQRVSATYAPDCLFVCFIFYRIVSYLPQMIYGTIIIQS
jgi:hypothetical protein